MGVFETIKQLFGVLAQLAKVFPDWWRKRQTEKKAKLREEVRRLRNKRLETRRKMRDATLAEREKLQKIYFDLSDRIMRHERVLRED